MEFIDKIFKTYQKMLSENKFLTEYELEESYKLFKDNFGPEKLKSLDGEILLDTLFNHGNKESLVYWLEFKNDDELQTNRYGGIGGGSALKFGIYKRKEDGKWITGSPAKKRELNIDEAVNIAQEKRDLLVKGAELIAVVPNNFDDNIYLKLQEDIDNKLENLGNLGWVHKYYHMLYPDKIDDFHSVYFQKFYLIKMLVKPIKSDGRYALSCQYIQLAKQAGIKINHFTASLIEYFGHPHRYCRIGITDDSKSHWDEILQNNHISIGWPDLGDLGQLDNLNLKEFKEQLKKLLIEKYPNKHQSISRTVNQISTFYKDIKPNDIIVAANGQKVLGIGKIKGEYEYKDEYAFPHCLNTQWHENIIEKLPNPNEGLRTTVNFYKDIDNMLAIEKGLNTSASVTTFTPSVSLNGVTGKIEGILNRKKQVILYGPPGTGKTYWAEKACLEMASRKVFKKTFEEISESERTYLLGDSCSKGLVRFSCFHPSYGYEDFIEGIKPHVANGQTVFSLKAGIFKRLCEEAKDVPNKNFYLIIDEINRGDISRIFGELITLIEIGRREKEMILPLSGESFSVPENVYIVGTMNTADRSIALLDVALRRRFGFLELMPDYNLLSEITIENLPISLWLSELNGRLVKYVGRDARNLQIGHSYFMENGLPIKDFNRLCKIIQEDVIPLIEEYCYGDYGTISKIIGSSFVDINKQEINHALFKSINKDDLISALLEPKPEIATSSSIKIVENEDERTLGNVENFGEQEL